MDKKILLGLIEKDGHAITKEIEDATEQLIECIEAEDSTDITGVLKWLEEKRKSYTVNTTEIGIKDLDKWQTDPKSGNISHETGRFFSIIGVKVEGAKGREVLSWTQPMMKQEECGILGILRQKKNKTMRYLFYAKYEPGTIASLQLSPTLQATESNSKQFHGGSKPNFIEYFENNGGGKALVSVVEVEDPGRFYHKTNRCMIVDVDEDEDINIPEDYIWLTLPQIKKLLKIDNVVNALARCVLGSR